MIVLDTSALVAILLDEPERQACQMAIQAADARFMSSATLLEARIVLHRRNPSLVPLLENLLTRIRVQVEPVTERQSDIAFDAFRRYGKGSGHSAGLNFGDCFAYALASERGLPLLFKGDDFRHTDITPV